MNEYDKSSRDITVKVGEQFAIILETVSTSGYLWHYSIEDNSKLRFDREDVVIKDTDIGAPSYSKFIFQALEKGKTSIEMNYARQWETEVEAHAVFYVTIE